MSVRRFAATVRTRSISQAGRQITWEAAMMHAA